MYGSFERVQNLFLIIIALTDLSKIIFGEEIEKDYQFKV